jgi:hypothetical protein
MNDKPKLSERVEDVRQRMLKRTANARRTKFDLEVMITLQMARDFIATHENDKV